MTRFTIAKAPDCAYVSFFPPKREVVELFKASFAEDERRFNKPANNWRLDGSDAGDRLVAWVAEADSALAAKKEERLKQAAACESMFASFTEEGRAEAVRTAVGQPINSELCAYDADDEAWLVSTPYDPRIVGIMRDVPGASFKRGKGAWRVPAFMTELLREAIPDLEAFVKEAATTPAEKRPDTHWVSRPEDCPAIGQALDRDGEMVTPVSVGAVFPASKFIATSHPDGAFAKGDEVRYVYYRPSTPEEIEALEAANSAPRP